MSSILERNKKMNPPRFDERIAELSRIYKNRRPVHDKPYSFEMDYDRNILKVAFIGNAQDEPYWADRGVSHNTISEQAIEQLFEETSPCLQNKPSIVFRESFNILDTSQCTDELFECLTSALMSHHIEKMELDIEAEDLPLDEKRLNTWAEMFSLNLHLIVRTLDPDLALCTGRQLDHDLIASMSKLQQCVECVYIHVVHGLPFLTKNQRISNTINTVNQLFECGFGNIVVEPEALRRYSLLRALYDLNCYELITDSELSFIIGNLSSKAIRTATCSFTSNFTDLFSCEMHSTDDVESDPYGVYAYEDFSKDDIIEMQEAMTSALLDRKMRKPIAWIGLKESDISSLKNVFDCSLTNVGSGLDGNFARNVFMNRNLSSGICPSHRWSLYEQYARDKIRNDSQIRFMVHSSMYLDHFTSPVLDHIICVNDEKRHSSVYDKYNFRKMAEGVIPIPECHLIECRSYSPSKLEELFGCIPEKIVVQKTNSAGGAGTFFLDGNTSDLPSSFSNPTEQILISKYYANNASVNAHIIVFDQDVLILPCSVQIILSDTKYCGGDFAAFQMLPFSLKRKFWEYCQRMGEVLAETGFRGIAGLDAILCDDDFIFIEINARFQSSTNVLNHVLVNNGFPTCQELVYESFFFPTASVDQEAINASKCNYSFITESYHHQNGEWELLDHILAMAKNNSKATVFEDGIIYDEHLCLGDLSLFTLMFNETLSSFSDEGYITFPPNLCYENEDISWYEHLSELPDDQKILSISNMLEKHGISSSDVNYFNEADTGKTLNQGISFTEFSPLSVKNTENGETLFYLEHELCEMSLVYERS